MDHRAGGQRSIPTGSLRLDIALGIGGLPRGRFIEIYGPGESGKTTLCQHIIAEAQSKGEECAFIDVDRALNPGYAKRCGVNPDRLYIAEPVNAEQALDIAKILARSNALAIIVIDSVNTLIPAVELKTELGQLSNQPRDTLLSAALRTLNSIIRDNQTTMIFTNLVSAKRNPIYHRLARNPARLALKLHSAVRLELRPLRHLQAQGKIIGNCIQAIVQKNSNLPCSQPIELDIMYNDGIEKTGEVFYLGLQLKIITRQGSTYRFREISLGNDKEQALRFLKVNSAICYQVEQIIRQKFSDAFV